MAKKFSYNTEQQTIGVMIAMYCRSHHHSSSTLCAECAQLRAVMRFSGPRMLLRHPILALKHML